MIIPSQVTNGLSIPVMGLAPGMIIHIEPHRVHGAEAGRHCLDVEVDAVRFEDDMHSCAAVDWHSCARFPGARAGQTGCTTYERTQHVLVIGGMAA